MAEMKVAKPTKEDFDIVYRFQSVMENLAYHRAFCFASPSDWKEWNQDDEDYKILKQYEKEVMELFGLEEDELEETHYCLILWRYIKWFFNYHPSALARVVMCADVAMLNAFDNRDDVDTIEWKPEIDEAITMYEAQKGGKDEKDNVQ